MIASSFLDPVIGLDVHFEMVPTPAPVPTPIPNPFTGIVFDPVGLACGIALGAAIGAVVGAPFQGPVLYWTAFPATNTGTEAKHIPGHILIPPGTAWAPFPKTPKPVIHPGETPTPAAPVVPENDAVVVFGSKTVTVMGSNAVRLGDIALSCSEPLRLPSSVVLAVPKGAPILIGGPPSLDLLAAAMASLRTRFVSDSLHALVSRLKPSRFRNFLHRGVCFLTGHPVDVASGKVLSEFVDLKLPGPLPLKIERIYSSAFASRAGPHGHGWSSSIDQGIWRERGKVVLLSEDGREIEFDTFDLPSHRVEAGQQVYNPIERLTLHCEAHGRWRVVAHDGQTREFIPVPGRRDGRAMLARIHSRCGHHEIRFLYDERGWLEWVIDSCKRSIAVECDGAGRILALQAPRPEGEGRYVHRRYRYDDAGDLVEVIDPHEQRWRFAYVTHLLTQETDRNGLSFYFAYDGLGEDAWCVRTWGDGGIYDHVLRYDKQKHVTFVTNSRGYTTQYHMSVIGLVETVINPLGGKASFEYDPHTLALICETDPNGRSTRYGHDARGNIVEIITPDGDKTALEYDERNLLISAVDPVEGEWSWIHDRQGRVIERRASDGGTTHYRYQGGFLTALIEPGGRTTQFGYSDRGMLSGIRTADGGTFQWQQDALGRVSVQRDPAGHTRHFAYDLNGRLRQLHEADGKVQSFDYDPEGNLVRARDARREVSYRYQGLGWLVSRVERDQQLQIAYDLEGRLVSITNEAGRVYRFEQDERGEVVAETSFDGRRRVLERDAAGQVVKIVRPSGASTEFTYDGMGRAVDIRHSDGRSERFVYRGDGRLIEAHNDAISVRFERDIAGRVVCERQGEHWVETRYDLHGREIGLRSSFGAVQEAERNLMGDLVALRYRDEHNATGGLPSWEATIQRELMGDEAERLLPGGVRSRWARDRAGRPLHHRIWSGYTLARDLRYHWDPHSDQLRGLSDAVSGHELRFAHDALGNLAWAQSSSGAVELRMPDAIGNLFHRQDRSDRQYGDLGQLLAAMTHAGVRRYRYDDDSNLIERVEPDGSIWRFEWSAAGALMAVERPDGKRVELEYDALGRRIRKRFDGRVTHFIWHGARPLHEWTEAEHPLAAADEHPPESDDSTAIARREAMWAARPVRGPPEQLITWLFDPGTLRPAAKIVDGQCYSIINDHLGTPVAMYDASGERVWSMELDICGKVRALDTAEGFERDACPFRYLGQYEDAETGLYYNRFRYYDPEAAQYISQDPIDLRGGLRLHAYVRDPLRHVDVLGLVYSGGRHSQTSLPVGDGLDSHHMPAKATYADTALTPADGPAIKMDPSDHRLTGSYGASASSSSPTKRDAFDIRRQSIEDARAARAAGDMDRAKSIIDDAIMRDIADVQDIARRGGDPSKYDKAILEMIDSLDDDFYDRITRDKDKPPCS
ncbi:MAG: DUF6531 domain-containing protein [Enhygromyxa sp.]